MWFLQVATAIHEAFPDPRKDKKGWFLYNNPIERKFANNDIENWPPIIKVGRGEDVRIPRYCH